MVLHEIEQIATEADCLYTQAQVEQAIENIAQQINTELAGMNPVVLCVLNGGVIFAGLLLPRLAFPLQLDYIHLSRYGDNTTGQEVKYLAKPQREIKDRIILLVDDIHDEGITQKAIIHYCQEQGVKKVYSAMLVEKQHQRKVSQSAEFVGLTVPDRYVFGYGMDYKGYLRNRAGIYAVKGM